MSKLLSFILFLCGEIVLPFSRGPFHAAKSIYRTLERGDTWSSLVWINSDRINLNDNWMYLENNDSSLIAHRLGDYSNENTMKAARESLSRGVKLLEVDIFKDDQGYMRCHHGPDVPKLYQAKDCTLGKILREMPDNTYLILDIKTDFIEASSLILDFLRDHLKNDALGDKLVFQLYKPSDIRWFHESAEKYPRLLRNKPIVTLYRSHIVYPLASAILPSSIGAIAYPWEKDVLHSASIESYLFKVKHKLFVHPIDSCFAYLSLRRKGVSGVYAPSKLKHCLLDAQI